MKKDVKNEESINALKSAQKLNECGNYLLFKNFYTNSCKSPRLRALVRQRPHIVRLSLWLNMP